MAVPILPITPPRPIEPLQGASLAGSTANKAVAFSQAFNAALSHVSQSSAQARSAVQTYLEGGNQELHSVILATQNASLDLQLLLQVRNKVVSAYEEIMKMQI